MSTVQTNKKPVQVNEKWFEEIKDSEQRKIKGFMKKSGDTKIFCDVCNQNLEIKNGSKTVITNHLKSRKHQDFSKLYFEAQAERGLQPSSSLGILLSFLC